jgi:hypothetical protein
LAKPEKPSEFGFLVTEPQPLLRLAVTRVRVSERWQSQKSQVNLAF